MPTFYGVVLSRLKDEVFARFSQAGSLQYGDGCEDGWIARNCAEIRVET
jgi:hypothetical protein